MKQEQCRGSLARAHRALKAASRLTNRKDRDASGKRQLVLPAVGRRVTWLPGSVRRFHSEVVPGSSVFDPRGLP